MRKLMASSQPKQFVLRSSSAVSLNERFSQVLRDQLARPRTIALNTIMLPQRGPSSPVVALLVEREPSSLQDGVGELLCGVSPRAKPHQSRSIWTRLGWQRGSRRLFTPKPQGFWSFRNKYKWRSRFPCTYRRRVYLQRRLSRRHLLNSTNVQKLTAGQHWQRPLQRGGATVFKGRGQGKQDVPTRKQLDAQLDEYMSLSKSRLDQQLDDYMSMSRHRLDAELDEYMLMAGDTELQWDPEAGFMT